MAAGGTYSPIATTTLGSATSSITFSSINGYTDLKLVLSGAVGAGSGDFIALRFNGDTGSNYSATYLWGNGTTATSSRFSAQTSAAIGAMYSDILTLTCDIFNYANATTYKTAVARSNSSGNNTGSFVSLWRSTAAITSLTVLIQANTMAAGTTATLYGIAAA